MDMLYVMLYVMLFIAYDGRQNEVQFSPKKILDNVAAVSVGINYSGAIMKDGSLFMWGSNEYGQVGNGSEEQQWSPVKVLDNAASISMGDYHTGAITKDGNLHMWGFNESGQVGSGGNANQFIPVKLFKSEDEKMLDTPVISTINANATGVAINWEKVTGAEKYCVFKKTDTSWKKLGTTIGTTYTDTTAVPGSRYTYTIRCVTSDGKTYTSYYDTKGQTIAY